MSTVLHTIPPRTPNQLREHYEIEKELADRLRNSTWEERRNLYSTLYDELLCRVPHHPNLRGNTSLKERSRVIATQMTFLAPYLSSASTFLEVGPGDCALSLEVATCARQVYAVDVSNEITKGLTAPENFQLFISDGRSIPLPANSVDVAYSNQLMEHLHPDDALEQLKGIYSALAPSGVYICTTPNRLTGPHDISQFFDKVATGFHLKEYTVAELSCLFRQVGFSKIGLIVSARGRYFRSSASLTILIEKFLSAMPGSTGRSKAFSRVLRMILGIRMIGVK